jgi:hypothetical protein
MQARASVKIIEPFGRDRHAHRSDPSQIWDESVVLCQEKLSAACRKKSARTFRDTG